MIDITVRCSSRHIPSSTEKKACRLVTALLARTIKQLEVGVDSYCVIHLFQITSVYIRLWVPNSTAVDTVGEKRAGNLNELLWFRQRNFCIERKAKISHFMPALLFKKKCIFCSAQRSADVSYAPASSYFHYRNIAAIFFFVFSLWHVGLHALSSERPKSPAFPM